jgi:Putative protein-S-isoprenylcysteine methyltransferase
MIFILLGCIAFVLMFIFDLNKAYFIHNYINLCYLVGMALLMYSTIGIISMKDMVFIMPEWLHWLFRLLSFLSLIFMLYSLFFALPFSEIYSQSGKVRLIDNGIYALCRHPGVIAFFFFYIFLGFACGKYLMLKAALYWTIMDIIYSYLEDRWLFPKYIYGYEEYCQTVPFIIPNSMTIKKLIK